MGLSASEAKSALRFSLGYPTTDAEVEFALAAFPKAVERLRA
jgi:cysteine desulfurase